MTRKTLCFDSKKCVGCYACTVACMDQNDIDVVSDGLMYRHIAHIESKQAGEVRIVHVSMACMHCDNAECLDACPSGALRRDAASDAVFVRRTPCALLQRNGTDAPSAVFPFRDARFEKPRLRLVPLAPREGKASRRARLNRLHRSVPLAVGAPDRIARKRFVPPVVEPKTVHPVDFRHKDAPG